MGEMTTADERWEGSLSEDFLALSGLGPGSLVAGYRLEGRAGVGGMAVVFRARDQRLNRLVALKILAPVLAADEMFRRRFLAESRAAAAVDHPHIIPVYEAGEAGGALFIAMRFVAGGDLRGVLAREGPLPPGRAAGFISSVASALDEAHRAGLVHRDVKPANVLVDTYQDRPDHVYLSDFGVSKGARSSVSLTGTGQFLGTPEYSAPEQVQGRGVDGRADQYALACVAWELLTGSPPFEREQGLAVLLAHLSEPPPSLAQRRPDLAPAADQVLVRALAKVPEERYASCGQFADALRDALDLPPYISRETGVLGHPRTVLSARPEAPGRDSQSIPAEHRREPGDAIEATERQPDRSTSDEVIAAAEAQVHASSAWLSATSPTADGSSPPDTAPPWEPRQPKSTTPVRPDTVDPGSARTSGDGQGTPVPRLTRRRALFALAGAGAAAGIAAGGWELAQRGSDQALAGGRSPGSAHTEGSQASSRATASSSSATSTAAALKPPGTKLWSFRAPGPVRSGPMALGNVVYAANNNSNGGSNSHNVYAFNAATGNVIWTAANYAEDYTRLTVGNNLVYFGSDFHTVTALHTKNGNMAWQYTTGDLVFSTPAVFGKALYVGSEDRHLYALNAITGNLIWRYKASAAIASGPAATDGAVYAGCDDQNIYAIAAATGALMWRYQTGTLAESQLAVTGGVVFAGSDSVYAINAQSGRLIWSFSPGDIFDAGITVANGVVYAGTGEDNNLYAINASTGKEIWSYAPGGNTNSGIAVAGGVVYFGSDDHKIYALDAATGREKWVYVTGGQIESGISVLGKRVFAGSDDGHLYALQA